MPRRSSGELGQLEALLAATLCKQGEDDGAKNQHRAKCRCNLWLHIQLGQSSAVPNLLLRIRAKRGEQWPLPTEIRES